MQNDCAVFRTQQSLDEGCNNLDKVIAGWTEGVQLMTPGSKYQFFIPYDLAYGEEGRPPTIPGSSALIFEVELLAIS